MDFSAGSWVGVATATVGAIVTVLKMVRDSLKTKDDEIARLNAEIATIKDEQIRELEEKLSLIERERRESQYLRTHVTRVLPSSDPAGPRSSD